MLRMLAGLIASLAAAAQASATTFEGFGVKAGLCRSQMRLEGGSYAGSEWRHGLIAGATARLRVSPRLTVEPGLVFAQRGGTYRHLPDMLWGGQATVDVFEVERNYLELPVLLRCGLAPGSKLDPTLIAGPAIGWVLSSRNLEDGAAYPDQSGEHDMAVIVGGGIEHAWGGLRMGLDVTYRHALTGVADEAQADAFRTEGLDVMVVCRAQ